VTGGCGCSGVDAGDLGGLVMALALLGARRRR
jgi:MYXO-CTERM domain-containing protein